MIVLTDIHSPDQRSYNMSRIRGQNTKPELMLRKALWNDGLRYRLRSKLPGRPDLIYPVEKIAVFVDGCFWHKCPKHFTWPKNNAKFWKDKISGNVRRDRMNDSTLQDMGWTVLRFWEHEISEDVGGVVETIALTIKYKKRFEGQLASAFRAQ